MQDKLEQLKKEILGELEKIKDLEAFQNFDQKYLSRKGKLSSMMKEIGKLADKEKKEAGQKANEFKKELVDKVRELKEKISPSKESKGAIDPTLPGEKIKAGHLHPITLLIQELEDVFTKLGFMVLDGPELESDYYCFEALNIPRHHPARDMQDTFYLDKKNKEGDLDLVMRTQTSPVQVRAMQKYGAPIKCVIPGRVFRSEATDSCHDHTFYQLEGLMVGKDISVANLIAVMKEMLSQIFRQEIEIRIRPGYFPFVEPGLEVDIRCTICNGLGCPSCKHSGWLEMVGAGMVHPKVLEYGGVDPNEYSGFAFGLGLTRMAMMRYKVDDIRLFQNPDVRFLEQF